MKRKVANNADVATRYLVHSSLLVDVIVTRHEGLVEYIAHTYGGQILFHREAVTEDVHAIPIIPHANVDDVRNKIVMGVLPLSLACLATCVIEIPLKLEPQDRGHELMLRRMLQIAQPPVTYYVLRHMCDETESKQS